MGYLLDAETGIKEHPEFFSRDRNGKALSVPMDGVHACLSNAKGREVVTSRFLKWMERTPDGIYYALLQGDGRNLSCQCDSCRAMVRRDGNYTDSWLRFVNSVARVADKRFPQKHICTVAYVDTEEPPVRTKPHPKVLVFYAIYPPSWSNHLMAFDPKLNKKGMQRLEGWIRVCPDQLYIEEYPISYAERLNIWPALYATVERIRFYAKQPNIKGLEFCGFMPGWNCFSEMQRYVVSKVLWNPQVDVEKEIDAFMALYYGPAAPHMREFFDLVYREARERGLAMRCEGALRGLVTKELAQRAYAAVAEAEKATEAHRRYFDRVEFEKLFLLYTDLTDRCLANGRVGRNDLPEYARRLAEFAQLAGRRWRTDDFARRVPARKWFQETAFIELTSPVWYEDPALKSLIASPLETVERLFKGTAKSIDNGWVLQVNGGHFLREYGWKCPPRKGVTALRRPSSRQGAAAATLVLAERPGKAMRLELEGLDNDKQAKALMQVKVNGKELFKGRVPFRKTSWEWRGFAVPSQVLRKGENRIEFRNITPDVLPRDEADMNDVLGVKDDYTWGWFILSGVRVLR